MILNYDNINSWYWEHSTGSNDKDIIFQLKTKNYCCFTGHKHRFSDITEPVEDTEVRKYVMTREQEHSWHEKLVLSLEM